MTVCSTEKPPNEIVTYVSKKVGILSMVLNLAINSNT